MRRVSRRVQPPLGVGVTPLIWLRFLLFPLGFTFVRPDSDGHALLPVNVQRSIIALTRKAGPKAPIPAEMIEADPNTAAWCKQVGIS